MKISRFIPMARPAASHPGRRRATQARRRHAGRWSHHSVEALESRCLLAVSPASFSATLLPGGSVDVAKVVTTPTIPPNPDIAFLADTTGSMGVAIGTVQADAAAIFSAVLAVQPTAQFSVSEYKDIGDPFEFKVDQALTANTTDVQNGINQWVAGGGGDTPESQLQALFEIGNGAATWRPDSTRIVVWFGDSSGHDPAGSLGITEAQAISALQANNVKVIAVPLSCCGDGLDATGQATRITSATGGVLEPTDTPPDQVTNAILAGLESLPITVTPQIVGSTGPLSVSFSPTSETVTSGTDADFTESISVPPGTPGQVVTYQVNFLSDSGSVLGTEDDTITIPTIDKLGLLLLDPTGSQSLMVTGNGDVTVNGDRGAVVVDSNASTNAAFVTGNGSVTAGDFDVTGGVFSAGNGVVPSPVDHETPTPNPLSLALPLPLPPAPVGNTATMLNPGTYVGGLHLSGKSAVTLLPGVYVMEGGGFSVSGQASVMGNGVVIINIPSGPSDTISVTTKGPVTLSAPTSGPYQGVAVFQASDTPVSFSGQAKVTIAGVVYTPAALVSITGNAVVTINSGPGTATLPPIAAAMIAFDLKDDGNGVLTINADDPPSGSSSPMAAAGGTADVVHSAALAALTSGGSLSSSSTLTDQEAMNEVAMSLAGTDL